MWTVALRRREREQRCVIVILIVIFEFQVIISVLDLLGLLGVHVRLRHEGRWRWGCDGLGLTERCGEDNLTRGRRSTGRPSLISRAAALQRRIRGDRHCDGLPRYRLRRRVNVLQLPFRLPYLLLCLSGFKGWRTDRARLIHRREDIKLREMRRCARVV